MMLFNRIFSVIALVVFCANVSAGGRVRAQGFLEKLEQAVRNQIDTPAESAGSSEELPPPKPKSNIQLSPSTSPPTLVPPQPAPAVTPQAVNPSPSTQLSSGKPTGRIYLGLEAENNIGTGIGVRVSNVTQQSPAWKAGFEVGDRIVAVNGFAIGQLDDMVSQLAKTSPGQSVRFLISRAGKNMQLTAVLMDAELASRVGNTPSGIDVNADPFLGLTVNDLTSSFRRQFGIGVFRGAAVAGVANPSPAKSAGIRPGDAVVEADGVPIESASDLMRWIASTRPGQQVDMMVYRGGFARNVQLVIGIRGATRTVNARPPIPDPGVRQPVPSNSAMVAPATSSPSVITEPPASESFVPSGNTPAVPIPSIMERPNDPPSSGANVRELAALKSENKKLISELAETKLRLEQTEAKLKQIMELLQNRD